MIMDENSSDEDRNQVDKCSAPIANALIKLSSYVSAKKEAISRVGSWRRRGPLGTRISSFEDRKMNKNFLL